MDFEFINLDVRGPVGWFRFNRPPRNAVHWEMFHEFYPALEALQQRPDVRVIVIATAVPGHFSAGADLSVFQNIGKEGMRDWVVNSHRLARAVRESEKPVLAAIDGIAVGGGLEMTLHADLRFAGSNARFGQPEVNIGFVPPLGGTQGLVRLVGRSNAFRILYGGDIFSADVALQMGLVDFLCEPDGLESDVQAYGEMLATKPANTLAAIRRCLIEGGDSPFDDGLAVEAGVANALGAHPNFEEGVTSFLEKRKPNWV